ncbi:manganese efflux pump MntP family protein [Oceanobacillus halophilus]|uniref:Putative manganese efflux pump MntP n=1 Tax=Oceanobacillus halophilus TaxID=930130 RepID=A0A495A463_9BACI|nr:manganese efflux pump MntP family protein [Oceanobacillus halophilus]RKQ34385.1 manganese efflux pump [Oceanobacillus halophilus]
MAEYYIGEIISLLFMAFALGMDAFSVSLGMGMQQLRLKRIAIIGLAIGLFHIMMPFIGILLGKFISEGIGDFATIAGGVLLLGIGAQMIINAFIQDTKQLIEPVGFGLLVVALTVSLDSFSVGLGLGMSGAKTALAIMMFGAASTILTWTGLLLGRKVRGFLGVYSEILGGSILCGFGINILMM